MEKILQNIVVLDLNVRLIYIFLQPMKIESFSCVIHFQARFLRFMSKFNWCINPHVEILLFLLQIQRLSVVGHQLLSKKINFFHLYPENSGNSVGYSFAGPPIHILIRFCVFINNVTEENLSVSCFRKKHVQYLKE